MRQEASVTIWNGKLKFSDHTNKLWAIKISAAWLSADPVLKPITQSVFN